MTKICDTCMETKNVWDFYVRKDTGKIRSTCKSCMIAANLTRSREESAVAQRKEYRKSGSWKESQKNSDSKRDRAKVAARNKVKYEVKMGRLEKKPCGKCGEAEAEAHHEDYGKPLEVEWLCRKCHVEHHRGQQCSA